MKFAFSLKNKLKIAVLLFCIMCCTLLIRFLEDKSVKKINESFVSMYHDRLVPATDLFFIAENLFQKSSILQNTLSTPAQNMDTANERAQLAKYNLKIDSVISKYELTLLVKQEKKYLNDFKISFVNQKVQEDKILELSVSDLLKSRYWHESIGKSASAETLAKLSALIRIQSEVGDELLNDSKIFVSGTKVYSALQVILAIAIGILIVGIISASNAVKIEQEKFKLN